MKKIVTVFVTVLVMLIFTTCELLQEMDDQLDDGLSRAEVVEGLKTALNKGAETASGTLSAKDGYYLGESQYLRIPLPEDIRSVRETINNDRTLAAVSETVGLEQAFEDVILGVNRAAEDAASEAAPVFKKAITNLTIVDAMDILNGQVPGPDTNAKSSTFDSTAATAYLKMQTYDSLTNVYAPKINTSLSVDLVGSLSANDAWSRMTTLYNDFMGRSDVQTAIQVANFAGSDINLPSAINEDLGEYSTHKALDGLFYMVGRQEKDIRKDPYKWAEDILNKVFGSV